MLNALEILGKKLEEATMCVVGAGAAAISCTKLLIPAGMKPENIFMCDRKGAIHSGRYDLNQYQQAFAIDTDKRTVNDAMTGADILLGLPGPDMISREQIMLFAEKPIIYACANPVPEIMPEIEIGRAHV